MANLPDFLGINLGHSSIKIAKMQQNAGKISFAGFSSTPTSFGVLEDDSDKGLERLASDIQTAIKNSKFKTKNCVLSVPETGVFARLLTLPKVKEDEVNEAINWALKPLVPVPMETLNISFVEIDEKKIENVDYVNWYAVAAPKDLITKFMKVFEKAGLNLLAVETESLALARMVHYNYVKAEDNKDILMLDLGAETTNVVLARNGVPLFSQSISTGSNAITKVLSADFGIDMVQAEKYKISYGLDFSGQGEKIGKSIQPIVDLMMGEALRTITYYKEKIGGTGINKIFLSGGGSGLLHLDTYFAEKLGIETIIVDVLKNISADPKLKTDQQIIHQLRGFNISIGLALKGLA